MKKQTHKKLKKPKRTTGKNKGKYTLGGLIGKIAIRKSTSKRK